MRALLRLSLLCVILTGVLRCSSAADDSDDTTNSELASSATEFGDVSGAGATGREEIAADLRATCASLAFGACDSATKTQTRAFSTDGGDSNPCTRGTSNGRNAYGKAILTFSEAACAFSTTGATVTRSLSNHYIQRGNNGYKVLTYTAVGTVGGKALVEADLKDFEGTVREGGGVLKKGSGATDTLTITGIHRRGLKPNGRFGFWHTLWSDADGITVTRAGSGASATATLSGTMYLMHNRAGVKVTKTLTDVKFENGCHLPTGGSISYTTPAVGTTAAATVTVVFSGTCGTAAIDSVATDLDPNT
jgi:hypothetical protein